MNEPDPSRARVRVLLLIPHLGGGGAEQVIALLARNLSREKYDLHLALVAERDAECEAGALPPWVTVHRLGAARVRLAALRVLRLLYRLRPRIVLSGMFHLNFLVLLLRPLLRFPVAVLIRQNGTASSALAALPRYHRLLYRLLYRRADRVVCQSQAMARDLEESFAVPADRLQVLPNPVDFDAQLEPASSARCSSNPDEPLLLAVGRLSHEKGLDLLLRAFAQVRSQFPMAKLVIAGDGPEQASVAALSRRLELEPAVRFLGRVARPADWFPQATLFVLSSRHEGLPNALLEAAAAGLPIVTTPASAGLAGLVRGQPGVWLSSEASAEALADSLLAALAALAPRQRFAHGFVAPFRLEASIAEWERFLDGFAARPHMRGVRAQTSVSDAAPAKR